MSADPIRVLIVEDDLVDRLACRRMLAASGGRFELIEADSGGQGLEIAATEAPDCILLDYRLPDLTGLEFLGRLAEQRPRGGQPPVLMLTGADSAAVAAESIRRGAREYLVKDVEGAYLQLLPGAVERLQREQRLINEQRRTEARFRTLVEQIHAISYVVAPGDPERLQYISPQVRVLGYTAEEWLADPGLHAQRMLPDEREGVLAAIRASRASGQPLRLEYRLVTKSGATLWFRDQADMVQGDDGEPLFMQGILVDITANKLAEQELERSHRELRRLAAHQETIKEQERQRIAREIHDELGGLLTGIKAYISVAAERARAGTVGTDGLLDEAAGLAQTAIETVRRVITDLRPSVLDQLGIWAALEWYVAQVAQRSNLDCRCTIDEDTAASTLDDERSIMLFRVAQEALTNVVRHAGASRVQLCVRRTGNVLEMTVDDDGKGIGATDGIDGTRDAWGILGMQERSRRFGGDVTVSSQPGRGTRLLLRVPLEEVDG
ncbi:two-component system sensor histidine kinase UhpB [Pseudoduganella flava]|uniref:Response regulator n=1 Tax=Pseudoduganella flava TaxID=871742 RepID=A0A562PQP1_9BURK|nr:response regulator [Pseudoduganella flava]QGZ37928.1 response regulator [Pseudoduganella flava]TWI46765.1 two-component system sensor histidine kinase UhpB [Pseudoduganella flava]